MSEREMELNPEEFLDTAEAQQNWAEREHGEMRGAIDLAAEGVTTWLTRKGRRVAKIAPADD